MQIQLRHNQITKLKYRYQIAMTSKCRNQKVDWWCCCRCYLDRLYWKI